MLEDDFTYVVRKALRGHSMAPAEAAVAAGIPENEVLAFTRGRFSAETARRLAPVLGLDPEALANHPEYRPGPLQNNRIERLDLPFGDERVNAWAIREGGTLVMFDTGYLPGSCRSALGSSLPERVFITHDHADHVGGLRDFAASEICRPDSVRPDDFFQIGPFNVRACDLSGHAVPALGYHVEGLGQPVLVMGDALFAGSIGGCPSPERYQQALSNLREVLAPLPDRTLLLPGHGPATTLGEERRSNPFIATAAAGFQAPR